MTKFIARTFLLIVAFLFFLGAKQAFSQDTTTVFSHSQNINLGSMSKKDTIGFKLDFFKLNEEKILVLTRLSDGDEVRITAEELVDGDASGDTTIYYFTGKETKPLEMPVKLALAFRGQDLFMLAIGTSEGNLFYYIDTPKAKL